MKHCVRVEVSLKAGHSDPEGETTAHLLRELGYRVQTVDVSKVYSLVVETDSRKHALSDAEEICKRLLANPTKDNYTISIEEHR